MTIMAESTWYAIQTYSGHENKVQKLIQRRIAEEPGEEEQGEHRGWGYTQTFDSATGQHQTTRIPTAIASYLHPAFTEWLDAFNAIHGQEPIPGFTAD